MEEPKEIAITREHMELLHPTGESAPCRRKGRASAMRHSVENSVGSRLCEPSSEELPVLLTIAGWKLLVSIDGFDHLMPLRRRAGWLRILNQHGVSLFVLDHLQGIEEMTMGRTRPETSVLGSALLSPL